jgi:hypothetical protein
MTVVKNVLKEPVRCSGCGKPKRKSNEALWVRAIDIELTANYCVECADTLDWPAEHWDWNELRRTYVRRYTPQ